MNANDIVISRETTEDEAEIEALFEGVFRRPLTVNIFRWWKKLDLLAAQQVLNSVSPFGVTARAEGKLVGYLGVRLRLCLINGEAAVAGELINGMVEKTFRRQGISTALCARIVEKLNIWGIDILYGIPNQQNARPLAKAGMKERLVLGRWTKTHSYLSVFKSKIGNSIRRILGLSLSQNIKSDLSCDHIVPCVSPEMPGWTRETDFLINRTTDYWRVRYDQSPRTYRTKRTSDGCFVLRLDAYGSRLSAVLVDLLPDEDEPAEGIQRLIKSSMNHAWSLGAQTFEARAIEGSKQEFALQSLGFRRRKGNYPISFAMADRTALLSIKPNSVWMTTGDFDIG